MAMYLAEFLGTLILVLLGDGVVANVVLKRSKGENSGWIVIATGWGLAVAMAVYVTGWVSGAHINPAVTLGLAAIGDFSWDLVPGFILAQIIGAFCGAILVYLSYKRHFDETTDKDGKLGVFCTAPGIRDIKWNVITEIIGTAMLLIGVLGIGNSNNNAGAIGALLVGFLVWSIGLSLGGPTGYAINPARDLGPRIAHALLPIRDKRDSDWGYAWVPVIAPIIGGILGAFVYKFFLNMWI
ncbi:aquaporin family protein [Clostridium sp. D2Q-11]|uniref:Aquaporin family protein n=1 Tax=Anaeromonas frigoriresistens TaxID=2683708 RepID=A0A942Z928_9FIRM|nr:MIP/aquaporin family protein [Anaeromonas frigoriresistens]MBS4538659.1 aquaporin family protein [Anaeromonas frigoriresistens]